MPPQKKYTKRVSVQLDQATADSIQDMSDLLGQSEAAVVRMLVQHSMTQQGWRTGETDKRN